MGLRISWQNTASSSSAPRRARGECLCVALGVETTVRAFMQLPTMWLEREFRRYAG
jgi:hypothetical protein